jgi:protease-4
MHFNTLSAILRANWLIDRNYVTTHLPLIHGIITGQSNGAELFKGVAGMEQPFAISNGKRVEAYRWKWDEAQGAYLQIFNEQLFADNSTFVIPVIGPVLKYNGDCGEPGMIKRSGWLSDFQNCKKLTGLISWLDTPGGQADGTPQYADFIKTIDKPKIAFVDGGAYSAGAWIASAHDEIILSNKFAGFGSIGAYTTIWDFRGYFQKQGVKMHEIYPKESSEKNLAYRKALDGDFTMITEDVAELARYFISNFADNRAGKLKNDSWNKGRTFKGQEAIDIGLADSIGNFDYAVSRFKASGKIIAPKAVTQVSTSNINSEMNLPQFQGLANNATPTDEQIDLANAGLTENSITSVTLVRDSFITEAAGVTTQNTTLTSELAAANQRITDLQSSVATANNTIAERNNTITELNTKVEAFGKNAGANHIKVTGEDLPAEDSTENMDVVLANMAHNRAADGLGY